MNLHMSPAPHVHSRQTTQVLMGNVLIALVPCAIAALWFYGPSALMLMSVTTGSAALCEWAWQRLTGQAVRVGDLSACVTGLILAFNLPAQTPWWLAAIGGAFAVVIVKGLFGGLGGNFINPALAARAMMLASWPKFMTAWCQPTGWNGIADAVSAATPLASPTKYTLAQLFFGNIPGAIGETCKLAILLGLAWLLFTRTITWRIPVIMTAATALATLLFGGDPLAAVLSGGLLFGAVFMATDYVTCPMHPVAQILYAAGAGVLVAVIRKFAGYPEGVTYAILLMNIAAPLLDHCFKRHVYGHNKEANEQNV